MAKTNAVFLVLLGGVFMSFVGLYMRLISDANGFQILFYRSIGICSVVCFVCCLKRRTKLINFLRTIDRNDVSLGLALSLAFTCYVFAMLNTSVASALLILSITPFLAASMGWFWIGERPTRITWYAMFFAFIGVFFMVKEGQEFGNNLGNFMALLSGFWFAVMLIMARKSGKKDVLGGTFIGGFFCGIFGLFASILVGTGLSVLISDFLIILWMGIFGIGIGIALVTWGASYVPAAEVSVIVLIESVLGPIWPWLFLGEAMTFSEILGGLLILGSVITSAFFNIQQS